MSRTCATSLLLAPLLLLQAAPLPAERRGEAFTFRMRLGPIESGRARLAIAPPHRDKSGRTIHVLGEAEAVGLAKVLTRLRDDYRLVVDADTFLVRRMEVKETGLRERTVTASFSGREADIHLTRADATRRVIVKGHLPFEPRDPVAALLTMRAARLHPGDRLEMVVLDGAAFYKGWVEVIGRELLQTDAGARPAIRLRCRGERIQPDGTPAGKPQREVLLWLSDDALRVPLRMEGETDLGRAQIELTSHEPPKQPLPAPPRLPGLLMYLHGG